MAGGPADGSAPWPQYPLIGEFGEEHIFSAYEAKETSLLKSEKASLQQQLNQFQHEVSGAGGTGDRGGSPGRVLTPTPALQLQKSKEREEQLDEMIQAYEKLCVEKADLESELGEMVGACGWRGRWHGGGHCGPLPHAGQIASPLGELWWPQCCRRCHRWDSAGMR